MLEKDAIHMVTFTSSSTVTNFVGMFGSEKEQLTTQWMKNVKVACIGPITGETAEKYGFSVDLMPKRLHHRRPDRGYHGFFQRITPLK